MGSGGGGIFGVLGGGNGVALVAPFGSHWGSAWWFLMLPPPPQVGAVLEELGPSMGQPLAQGHHGVAVALMGACLQYKELQQGALRCLFQVSHAPLPP